MKKLDEAVKRFGVAHVQSAGWPRNRIEDAAALSVSREERLEREVNALQELANQLDAEVDALRQKPTPFMWYALVAVVSLTAGHWLAGFV